MTSSTSAASTRADSSAALIAAAPNSCAGVLAKAPLNEPTAVLLALAMTISGPGMACSLTKTANAPKLASTPFASRFFYTNGARRRQSPKE
jgi:hypothetical protein